MRPWLHSHVVVESVPPGAYVYGPDGRYMGETKEGEGVSIVGNCKYEYCDSTIVLKKPGYKETTHHWRQHFTYATHEDAEVGPADKLVVVLDTQME